MKIAKIILITFLVAFFTSALYEIPFIEVNIVRYSLVILLIVLELAIGFCYAFWELKQIIKSINSNQQQNERNI